MNLAALCPDAYDVHSGIAEGSMLRAVNVRLLLESQPLSPALKLAAQAAPLSFSLALSDELIPMTTGKRAMRRSMRSRGLDQVITENTRMLMIITTNKKLVPHLGCCRFCGLTFSTVRGSPAS